jgi:hypothetical protein
MTFFLMRSMHIIPDKAEMQIYATASFLIRLHSNNLLYSQLLIFGKISDLQLINHILEVIFIGF